MKLYFSPGACSLAPHICLNELNYVYELEAVDMKTKTTAHGDFTKINAKSAVPALRMENGEILTEGVAIMNYIAAQKPEANLMPKYNTTEWYRAMEWMNYIATELHSKNFNALWSADYIFPATANVAATAVETFKNYNTEALYKKFDYINNKLQGNDYCMGKNFTAVDAYLFTVVGWTKFLNIDVSKWSNLSAFMDRVYKRPAVQAAMKQEGILK